MLLGDSLTDGRGSTTNGNDRWPDQLCRRTGGRFDAVVDFDRAVRDPGHRHRLAAA